jgi:hypothetical protein
MYSLRTLMQYIHESLYEVTAVSILRLKLLPTINSNDDEQILEPNLARILNLYVPTGHHN